jgi:hypothetical protein
MYRSRLTVDAWQVCFDQTAPDWVLEESDNRIALKGWADSVQWYDVFCDQDQMVVYALAGDWIVRDGRGQLSCLSDDIFQRLYAPA